MKRDAAAAFIFETTDSQLQLLSQLMSSFALLYHLRNLERTVFSCIKQIAMKKVLTTSVSHQCARQALYFIQISFSVTTSALSQSDRSSRHLAGSKAPSKILSVKNDKKLNLIFQKICSKIKMNDACSNFEWNVFWV